MKEGLRYIAEKSVKLPIVSDGASGLTALFKRKKKKEEKEKIYSSTSVQGSA